MEEFVIQEGSAAGLGGTEGGRRPTGVPPRPAARGEGAGTGNGPGGGDEDRSRHNPEVLEKPQRRRFSAEYKLRILREADACREGELGALLRREGLYSSHLITWRKQRDQGILDGLKPKRRGRKPQSVNPLASENERLQRENQRLTLRLKQAETIIDVQKKVSELLGLTLPPTTPLKGNS